MRIDFNWNEEDKIMEATLYTEKGIFKGKAKYNKNEETSPPSFYVGETISAARAEKKYCKYCFNELRLQRQGLLRLLNSVPEKETKTINRINNLLEVIARQQDPYVTRGFELTERINNVLESKRIREKSKKVTKEEKEEIRNRIKESFKILSNQDKIDKN